MKSVLRDVCIYGSRNHDSRATPPRQVRGGQVSGVARFEVGSENRALKISRERDTHYS